MAETSFGALNAVQKKVWSLRTWNHGRDNSYWMKNGFVSTEMNSPVYRVTELTETERGLECVMQMVLDLREDGKAGDTELEGSEESLINDSQTITIDQLRHAVKSRGRMAEQATVLRFRSIAKDKLGFWLGNILDELMHLTAAGRAYTLTTGGATRSAGSSLPTLKFAADVAAATTNRIMYAGVANSESSLTLQDKMTWDLIVKARAKAERQRLRPIRTGGREYYCILMSTEQARDLKQDPDYKTIVKDAGSRGSQNELFTNALAVVDGVILHVHNKTFNTLDGTSGTQKWGAGANVDGAQALLLGAQAMGIATVGQETWAESDLTDYGNKAGIGYGRIFGLLKPQFKSFFNNNNREDYGTISIKTAAAA